MEYKLPVFHVREPFNTVEHWCEDALNDRVKELNQSHSED
jgi:hypothetical protein